MKQVLSTLLCALTLGASGLNAQTSNYCTWDETTHPRGGTDRVVRALTVNGATHNGSPVTFSVPIAGTTARTQTSINFDRTSSVLEATVGDQITVGVSTYSLHWTHFYLFIDYNHNGVFDTNEVVSYSHLKTSDTPETWTNSLGAPVGAGAVAEALPVFTIPTTAMTGQTRVRFKADWNSLDPCGNTSNNELLSTNRGTIADFTININPAAATPATAPFSFTFDSALGSVTAQNAAGESVASGTSVEQGTRLTLNITPNAGQEIASVMVGGTDRTADVQNGTLTLIATGQPTEVVVTFRAETPRAYVLDVLYFPNMGTVTVTDASGNTITPGQAVTAGTSCTVAIQPTEGYTLAGLEVNGQEALENMVNGRYTFTMPAEKMEIIVYFLERQFEVSLSAPATGGTVELSDYSGVVVNGDPVYYRSEVTVAIRPDAGYEVDTFTINGVDRKNQLVNGEYTHTVDLQGFSVVVTFRAINSVALLNDTVRVYGRQGAIALEGLTEEVSVEVFDLAGKLVLGTTAMDGHIVLPAGAYIVRLAGASSYKVQVL